MLPTNVYHARPLLGGQPNGRFYSRKFHWNATFTGYLGRLPVNFKFFCGITTPCASHLCLKKKKKRKKSVSAFIELFFAGAFIFNVFTERYSKHFRSRQHFTFFFVGYRFSAFSISLLHMVISKSRAVSFLTPKLENSLLNISWFFALRNVKLVFSCFNGNLRNWHVYGLTQCKINLTLI